MLKKSENILNTNTVDTFSLKIQSMLIVCHAV